MIMNNNDDPVFMFPPDFLINRMEQVRKIVVTMSEHDFCEEELSLLIEASNILLDSVGMSTKVPTTENIVPIKH